MDTGQMVEPPSAEEPGACAVQPLPPLDEYLRVGDTRDVLWSALRTQILSLLWKSRKPWGAYGIAERLSRGGSKKHPNSVYRAIRNLETARLVIPIITWSRYVISPDPGIASWGVILCSRCRNFSVVPMPDEGRWLWSIARGVGFRPKWAAMECIATCEACSIANGD